MYTPSTLHFKWSGELRHRKELSEKMFLRFPKEEGRLRHQIRIRSGSAHSRQQKFHWNPARSTCAYVLYSKLEMIWPQLHTESCIPFAHIQKHDHWLCRVRKHPKYLPWIKSSLSLFYINNYIVGSLLKFWNSIDSRKQWREKIRTFTTGGQKISALINWTCNLSASKWKMSEN